MKKILIKLTKFLLILGLFFATSMHAMQPSSDALSQSLTALKANLLGLQKNLSGLNIQPLQPLTDEKVEAIFQALKADLDKQVLDPSSITDVQTKNVINFNFTEKDKTQSLSHIRINYKEVTKNDLPTNLTPKTLAPMIEKALDSAVYFSNKCHTDWALPHVNEYEKSETKTEHISKVVSHVLNNEIKNQDKYYVFYHAHNPEFRIIFDTCQQIYKWGLLDKNQPLALRVMQYEKLAPFLTAAAMLTKSNWEIEEEVGGVKEKFNVSGYWLSKNKEFGQFAWATDDQRDEQFDGIENVALRILSVNLSLFGNMESFGDSSMILGITGIAYKKPVPETILEHVFKDIKYNNADAFVQRLVKLGEKYFSNQKSGYILQFFIKKESVNNIAYLSNDGGRPFNDEIPSLPQIWDAQNKYIKDIAPFLNTFIDNPQPLEKTLTDLTKAILIDKDQKEASGAHPIDTCLHPGERRLDEVQARLWLLTPEMHDPKNVIVKRYNFNEQDIDVTEYYKELNLIVEDIIKDIIRNSDHFDFTQAPFKVNEKSKLKDRILELRRTL